jgi:ATP-dependent protease ClpP protease subunit
MRINVSVLGLVLLGTALYYVTPEPLVERNENIITFDTGFSFEAGEEFVEHMKDINEHEGVNERALVEITSSGGYVSVGEEMAYFMKKGVPVDTFVPRRAASMGVETFILGQDRYIDPDAELLLHGAYSGKYAFNEHSLKKAVELVNDPTMAILMELLREQGILEAHEEAMVPIVSAAYTLGIDTSDPIALQLALTHYIDYGKESALHELESAYQSLAGSNAKGFDRLVQIIQEKNPDMTEAYIYVHIVKKHARDVIITGREAYELGIATHLGEPDPSKYKED